jgi:hypothetical protein
MNYPAFRRQLLPLGSGAIESTVKNLMQQRQVLAGMRWTRQGAHAVANLRALHRSLDSWTAFWHSQPLRRAVLPRTLSLVSPAADQHALTPARPVAAADAAPPPQPPSSVPAPTAARILTAGKPWAKGKDHWRRTLPCTA